MQTAGAAEDLTHCVSGVSLFPAENAGIFEGQKGCWIFPERPDTDADMLVSYNVLITVDRRHNKEAHLMLLLDNTM